MLGWPPYSSKRMISAMPLVLKMVLLRGMRLHYSIPNRLYRMVYGMDHLNVAKTCVLVEKHDV